MLSPTIHAGKPLACRLQVSLLCAGAVFIMAAFFRFWAAPLSAGPDVAQFWAFADRFDEHGLDFYQYADAKDGTFPFWGWSYVYPPIWLLVLGLSRFFVPSSFASVDAIDEGWRIAMKTPVIGADLIIGGLIYWAVPGSKWKKLIFTSLWLFHPTAWYESAVFGQFDAIAAMFLLGSVIMLSRGSDRIAFALAGLALMTKQHTFLPILMMIVVSTRLMDWRRLAGNCSIMLGIVLAFSLPFLVIGNVRAYTDAIFTPGQAPGYQYPLVYAFSGSGSLLTYLHDTHGWETSSYLDWNMPVLAVVFIAALVLARIKTITPAQGALIGFILFIAIGYRINYQYLVIYIPIALLAASQARWLSEKIFTIVLAMFPAVWLWMFDVSFWFWCHNPGHTEVISTFDRIGWTTHLSSNVPYVVFAMVLMLACLAYVIMVFFRWRGSSRKSEVLPYISPANVVE